MPKHPYNYGNDAPDPQQYILVKTKDGKFYRRRRGSVTRAKLNKSFQKSADTLSQSSPAARRLRNCLTDVFRGLDVGRINARFSALLKKELLQKGRFDFSSLASYDFQKDHPLDSLLQVPYTVKIEGGKANVRIVLNSKAVKQKSRLTSDYYFEMVLVWGDPAAENGLFKEMTVSPLYPIDLRSERTCKLQLTLPAGDMPWMLLLKISCLEGKELAIHPRHYGMKVVAVG